MKKNLLEKIANNLSGNSKRPSLMKWFGHNKNNKQLVQREAEMQHHQQQTKKQSEESASSSYDSEESNTVNITRREVKALKSQVHFIPNLMTPSNALEWYAKMKVPASKVNTTGWLTAVCAVVGFIAPLFYKGLGKMPLRILTGIALAILIWYIFYCSVKQHFSNYRFENELRFNKVITVLDLSQLKRGYSINAVLASTAERFRRDKVLSDSISTLSSRIGDDPTSPRPYLEFAHEFSTTQRARLFMMAVYRMAQGHYDDTQIKSIKHSSAQDVTYQSKRLAHKKIARYRKLNLYLFGGFVVYFVVYILFFIVLFVSRSLGSAM